jgi:hypothetical protein
VIDATTGVTTISSDDLDALGSIARQGYKTFSLNGATISDTQAKSIFNILSPVTGTVTGAVVDVASLNNGNYPGYTTLGFSSNEFQYKESTTIKLSNISLQADGSATITGASGVRAALTAIAPPANSGTTKVTITGGDGQTAVTVAQLDQLKLLTGGKLTFSGVTVSLSGAELANLTSASVKPYISLGITQVSGAGAISAAQALKMQSAGLSFATPTQLSNQAVSLSDLQNLAKVNATFAVTTKLSGTTAALSANATDISISASAVRGLIGKLDLTQVSISDTYLSGADAARLNPFIKDSGLSTVTITGAISTADAKILVGTQQSNGTALVKGFDSSVKLADTSISLAR